MEVKQKNKNIYVRILRYLKPHRVQFVYALLAMVVYGATDGAVPFLIKAVLDNIFSQHNEQMLWILPLVLIAFAALRGVFSFLQHYLAASVGLAITRDIRNDINEQLLRLSPAFYSQQTTGALISRMTNDTLLVRQALTDSAAALLRDSIRVLSLLAAALYLDPVLGIIAFVAFPLGIYPVVRYGRKVRRLSRVGQDQFGGLTGILQETIVGHKVVQAFNLKRFAASRFREENEHLTKTFRKAEKYGALSSPTNEFIASIAIALVILYGGLSVMNGVRTQGDFIAFLTALFLLYEPLKKLGRVNNVLQAGAAAAERIFEIIDIEPEIADAPGAELLRAIQPRIEFSAVSFSYDTSTQLGGERGWAIKDVSLSIEPGETVALVGMSGGGKSTLVSLLPRFYDPQCGVITVGGVDIKQVTLESLRDNIAVVDQHTFLFNDSVLKNIQFGDINASEELVRAAAKAAHADTFISKLPEGYHTVIGEQGFSLSGGERARIAIARALLKDAPILVLDEATASLDSESERLVQEAIDCLMRGRTVLVIAHRLATVRRANKILVVVKGQVVEQGNHEELLARGGEYAKLHSIQFHDHESGQVDEARRVSGGE